VTRRIIIAAIAAALIMGGAIASHGTGDANAASSKQTPTINIYGSTWS